MSKLKTNTRHLRNYKSVECTYCDGVGYEFYTENDETVNDPCKRCFGQGRVFNFHDRYFNAINRAYQRNGMRIMTSKDIRN